MGDELKNKMVKALTWTSIDRFGQQLAQLIIGIVLARLLTPNDYGLIGVLMIFISLSTVLIDGGFGQALIRKQDANATDYSTIFYLNLIISVLLYLILFFAAPFIAIFFKHPELVLISRVLFLTIIFYAIYFIQYVVLNKNLNFKVLSLINIVSVIVSGFFGIILAFLGYGVWALVWQQISSQFIRALLYPFLVHWKPIRNFSYQVIKDFWSFSIHMLGTSSLNVIFNNLYTILLGRFYPFREVGFYTQANKLSDTVDAATQQILMKGTYPLLVQIQHDTERLIRVYRRLTQSISLLIFPLIAVLIAIAKPFILVLITDKWLSSVGLFQLLLLANFFGPLYVLNVSVLNARGESKLTFRMELIKKSLILLSVVVCFQFGIKIMLAGYVLASFAAYSLSMIYIKRKINHYFKHQIVDILPQFVMGFMLGVMAYFIGFLPLSNISMVILQVIETLIIYIVLVRFFFAESFFQAKNFILQMVSPLLKFKRN